LRADRPLWFAAVTATVAAGAATAVESLVVPYAAEVGPQTPWLPGGVLAAVAAVTLAVTLVAPTARGPTHLLLATILLCVVGSALSMVLLAIPSTATRLLGMIAVGLLFVPLVTANVMLAARLAATHRASTLALLMGGLTAMQASLVAAAGGLAELTAPAPAAAVVLGVPLVVGLVAGMRVRPLLPALAREEAGDRAGPPRTIERTG